ncbi:AraC family transcriptional regulator [Frigoribacterium sp. 2-23]|uniref:AraC family transcriptional regulator n=1 Tax=Frigoribacterium sp. 2-23 TaxID=3415006 RepID=UPI003C703F6F
METEGTLGSWPRERNTVVFAAELDVAPAMPPFAIRASSVMSHAPWEFAPHVHTVHELVWVREGTMTVRVDDMIMTVPDGYGVWIPAGRTHSGRTTAGAKLCDASFAPERSGVHIPTPCIVEVTTLLGALLSRLEQTSLSLDERLRIEAVVFDNVVSAPAGFALSVPHTLRVAPVVEALMRNPTDTVSLDDWSAALGLSTRTLSRIFRAETGLSFFQWRQALRVHHSVTLLADGLAVQDVAEIMGHANASSFIAAFKRVTGITPGAHALSHAAPRVHIDASSGPEA